MGALKERSQIDQKYQWKLNDLYPSDEEWRLSKIRVKKKFEQLTAFQGQLSSSSEAMNACLSFIDDIYKELLRLSSYASMKSDQDTRTDENLQMKQEIGLIFSDFAALSSFIEPEILRMDGGLLKKFLDSNRGLMDYRFYIEDLIRKKKHRGNEREEKIIAEAGLATGAAYQTFNIFTNAEFPYPEIELSDGSRTILNQSNFALLRAGNNRDDRKAVFESFFSSLGKFSRTLGSQLDGNLKKDIFYRKVRNYNSCLEAALDADNIPISIFHNLIARVNENLDTFHRYLNLRKRMMKVDRLHYYDLYAPLAESISIQYGIEEAREMILSSLHPFGKDYVSVVRKAFDERWIDYFPNAGKRSGAYSNGSAFDVHPYILMNFNGKYDDVSTLMHELGHTMHSYLSNKCQPFALSHYPIFVAEVASTLNEALLMDHFLKATDSDEVRFSLLGSYLDGVKGTLFRQTQFAEYEYTIHRMAEEGEAMTGETFSRVYFDLAQKYYGHDNDVCVVDDYVKMEWAYIPHFYYNFYVYQYATSFTASQALIEKILTGDQRSVDAYLSFLSSGGSKYPVDLLAEAGVDMNSNEPFNLTIRKINRAMNEMEALLDNKSRSLSMLS